MNPYDRISSLIWSGVGVAIVAIVIGSSEMKLGTWNAPGPGFMSMLTGVIIVFLGLIVFFKACLHKRKKKVETKARDLQAKVKVNKLFLCVAFLFLYAILLDPLGYVGTTFLFIGFMLLFVERTRWFVALATAVAVTFISYALFGLWLQVPLPKGPWGF